MPVWVEVEWIAQGSVVWEDWWTREKGHTRSQMPDLDNHISFAQYDLHEAGLPSLERSSQGNLYMSLSDSVDVSSGARAAGDHPSLARVAAVLAAHGFKVGRILQEPPA